MIRTQVGRVDLRRPREKTEISLHSDGSGRKPVTIEKGWLAKTSHGHEEYLISVKQAMLVASTRMRLEDLTVIGATEEERLQQTQRALIQGTAAIPRRPQPVAGSEPVVKQPGTRGKHLLTKRSKKCGTLKKHWFDIRDGRLHVYMSDENSAVASEYELSHAKCKFESTTTRGIEEAFLKSKEVRVMLQCAERPQGSLYLYPDDGTFQSQKRQATSWVRAISMSKFMSSESHRRAYTFVCGRLGGSMRIMGWEAFWNYYRVFSGLASLQKDVMDYLTKSDIELQELRISNTTYKLSQDTAKVMMFATSGKHSFSVPRPPPGPEIAIKVAAEEVLATYMIRYGLQKDTDIILAVLYVLEARHFIQAMLRDGDPEVKTSLVRALCNCKRPMSEHVIELMGDAAKANPTLTSPQPHAFRIFVIKELTGVVSEGDARASLVLLPLVEQDDGEVKAAVVQGMCAAASNLNKFTDAQQKPVRLAVVKGLGNLAIGGDAESIEAVCAAYAADPAQTTDAIFDDAAVREAVAELVSHATEPFVQVLGRLECKSKLGLVQGQFVNPGISPKVNLNLLVHALSSTDKSPRNAAATILADLALREIEMGSHLPSTADYIIETAAKHSEPITRSGALVSLGKIAASGDCKAEVAAFEALSDTEEDVRIAAANVFTESDFAKKFPRKAMAALALAQRSENEHCSSIAMKSLSEWSSGSTDSHNRTLAELWLQILDSLASPGKKELAATAMSRIGLEEGTVLCARHPQIAELFFQCHGLDLPLKAALHDLEKDPRLEDVAMNLAESSTREHTWISVIMDSVFPLMDYVSDHANAVSYILARSFGFLTLVASGIVFNVCASSFYMLHPQVGEQRYSKASVAMHAMTLGLYGYVRESWYCHEIGRQTNLLGKFKLCEAFESVVSFMVGVYSLLISGYSPLRYKELHGLALYLRWFGIATSLLTLPTGLAKISNRTLVFEFIGALRAKQDMSNFVRGFRMTHVQASLHLTFLAEFSWPILLAVLQLTFRPWGIFVFGFFYWLAMAIGMSWVIPSAWQDSKMFVFFGMTPMLMIMNPIIEEKSKSMDALVCAFRGAAIILAWACLAFGLVFYAPPVLRQHLLQPNAAALGIIGMLGSTSYFLSMLIQYCLGRFDSGSPAKNGSYALLRRLPDTEQAME